MFHIKMGMGMVVTSNVGNAVIVGIAVVGVSVGSTVIIGLMDGANVSVGVYVGFRLALPVVGLIVGECEPDKVEGTAEDRGLIEGIAVGNDTVGELERATVGETEYDGHVVGW